MTTPQEEEWAATPTADALVTFILFMMSVVKFTVSSILNSGSVDGFNRWVTEQLEPLIQAKLAEQPELAAHTDRVRALFDSDRDESLRNGLIVIASMRAFEACFEDFCKGMLQTDPSLIDGQNLDKLKVPLTRFLSATADEKQDVVYESIENSVGKGNGIDRYEDILGFLRLSESVPKPIKDAFYKLQVVRHVWAHRAGVADAKFIRQAPHLGIAQGELVAVTREDLTEYLTVVLTYVLILMNRHRAVFGLDPILVGADDNPDSPVVSAFRTVYPPSAT